MVLGLLEERRGLGDRGQLPGRRVARKGIDGARIRRDEVTAAGVEGGAPPAPRGGRDRPVRDSAFPPRIYCMFVFEFSTLPQQASTSMSQLVHLTHPGGLQVAFTHAASQLGCKGHIVYLPGENWV